MIFKERKLCYPNISKNSKADFIAEFENDLDFCTVHSVINNKDGEIISLFFIYEFEGEFNPVLAFNKAISEINKDLLNNANEKKIKISVIFSNREKNYLIKDINIRIYNIITDIKLSNYIKSLGKLPTKKPLITACSKIEYDLSRIKNQYEQIFCFGGDLDAILMKDSEMFCLIEYKSGTKNIDISEESYKRFEVDAFKYKTLKNNAKALGIPFINLIFNDTHFNAKIEYIFEEKEIIVRGTSIEDLSNKVKKEIYSFLN